MTFGESDDWRPLWSRDGERILFGSYRNGPLDLYARPARRRRRPTRGDPRVGGPEGPERLVEGRPHHPGLRERPPSGLNDVVAVTTWPREPRRLSPRSEAVEMGASDSHQTTSGWPTSRTNPADVQIYIQPFPPTGAKWQVTTDGGVEPRWRGDGRELYYLEPEPRHHGGCRWRRRPAFRHGAGAAGSDAKCGDRRRSSAFDVTQDGRRFLFVSGRRRRPSAAPMQVILNWPTLLGAGRSTRGRSR